MPLITLGDLEYRSEPTDSSLGNSATEPISFTRTKPLSLLTYLCMEGEQHRAFMAQLIWGRAKNPHNSLSQAIDQLMRLLPGSVEKTDTRVKALISCDAVEFQKAVREERYLDAIELYKGDFLKGNFPTGVGSEFSEWLDEMANLLAEQAQLALSRQARFDLIADVGRSKEFAEQAYKIFERTQVGEANIQFIYALLEHHGSIYAAKLAQVLDEYELASDAVVLDLEEIELEVAQKGLAKPKTRELISRDLPNYASKFFGRREELQNIRQMLLQPECRLLTLSGPGGMGKTRLATELSYQFLQTGEELSSETSSEQVDNETTEHQESPFEVVSFVQLEPLSNPDQIANTVAQTYKLALDSASDTLPQLIAYLQDTHHLMVLDNFEHILSEVSKQFVTDLLDGCPLLKVVITTREGLNIPHEWLVVIHALAYPKKQNSPKGRDSNDIDSYDAVQLFIDRATHANIRFKLNADNRDTVQKLIKQTAGLPLAIELAASWIRALPPEAILAELESSLEILTSPSHSEKHESLEITFEHSWQRLSEVEQRILQQLSVFEDGFTKEAATFLTNVNYLQLMALINKSLVQTTDSGRYFLHPLLGQYLDNKLLESGAHSEFQAKHAEYYMDYFSTVAKGFRTAKEGEALDAVEVEIENIKTAWLYACKYEIETVDSGLIWELRRFFDSRTQQVTGVEFFGKLAESDAARVKSECYALVLAAKAWLIYKMSRYDEAKHIAERAYSILEKLDDVSAKLNVVNTLGAIATRLGEVEESLKYFTAAVELAKQEEKQFRLVAYLANLSVAQRNIGDLESAKTTLLEALKLAEEKGLESERCLILLNLDVMYTGEGNYKQARSVCEEAIRIGEANRLEQYLPILYSNYADTLFHLDDLDAAERFCLKVLDTISGETHFPTKSSIFSTQAKILFAQGKYAKAKTRCRESVEIAIANNIGPYVVRALPVYAQILVKENDMEAASEVLGIVLDYPNALRFTKDKAKKIMEENDLKLIEESKVKNLLSVEDVLQKMLKDI